MFSVLKSPYSLFSSSLHKVPYKSTHEPALRISSLHSKEATEERTVSSDSAAAYIGGVPITSYDSPQLGPTTCTLQESYYHYRGTPEYLSVTPAPVSCDLPLRVSLANHNYENDMRTESHYSQVFDGGFGQQSGHVLIPTYTLPYTAGVNVGGPLHMANSPSTASNGGTFRSSRSACSVSCPRQSINVEDTNDEKREMTYHGQDISLKAQKPSDLCVSLKRKRMAGIQFAVAALSRQRHCLCGTSYANEEQHQNKSDVLFCCDNVTKSRILPAQPMTHCDTFVEYYDEHCHQSEYLLPIRKKQRVCKILTKGNSRLVSNNDSHNKSHIFNFRGHFDKFSMSRKVQRDLGQEGKSKVVSSLADIAASSKCTMIDPSSMSIVSKGESVTFGGVSQQPSSEEEKGAAYPWEYQTVPDSIIGNNNNKYEEKRLSYDERLSLIFDKACLHLRDEGLPFSSSVGETAVVAGSSIQSPVVSIKDEMQRVLYSIVRRFVAPIVQEDVGTTWASFNYIVRLFVSTNTVPLCPNVRGIIKRINNGRPAPVPIELLPEDDALIASIFTHYLPNDYIIDDSELGYQIRRYQLESCLGTEKLNDQVINYYLELVAHTVPGVVVLLSSLFSKLTSGKDREGAFRWVRRRNIFEARVVLVSINRNDHWTMCVVNNDEKYIAYYDSCGGKGTDVIMEVAKFLDECYARKHTDTPPQLQTGNHRYSKAFEHRTPGDAVPQQRNTVDCGVFTMQFGLYAAQGRSFNFTQGDVPFLRKLITIELIKKRLMRRL